MTTLQDIAINRAAGTTTKLDMETAFAAAVKSLGVSRADFLTVAKVQGYADRAAFSDAEATKYRDQASALAARGKDGAAARHLKVVERNERIRDEHVDKITAAADARPDLFRVDVAGVAL